MVNRVARSAGWRAASGAHGHRSRVGDVQERQVDGGRELVGQLCIVFVHSTNASAPAARKR